MKKNFTDILKQFKQSPPPGAWDRIEASLDENALAEKLKNFNATPPARTWQAIASSLDQPHTEHPLKAIRRRINPLLSAAAVVLLVVSAFLLMQQNSSETGTVAQTQKKTTPASPPSSPKENTTTAAGQVPDRSEPDNLSNTNSPRDGSIASSEIQRIGRRQASQPATAVQTASYRSRVAPIENDDDFVASSVTAVNKKISRQDYSAASEYMVYGAEDGTYTRVAKKIFPLLQCASWSSACKEQLKQLQDRISSASLSSGFAGFMDILSQLQENH